MNNKLKIGIQTFFQSNYGAVLQAYALRRYLSENFNAEVEVINFTTDKHKKDVRILKIQKSKNIVRTVARLLLLILRYPKLKRQQRRINQFKCENLHLTRRIATVKEMLANMPLEDIYVTGSDQVFNPKSPYSKVYYLAFDKKGSKKVAYAPSFGIATFPDTLATQIKGWLLDFDALSCREKIGADYMSSMLDKHIPTVVDPVLLLGKDVWREVMVSPSTKRPYVFVYDRNGGANLIKLAKKIGEETNMPVFVISSDNACHYKVDKIILDAGPREFIGYIANADYVVTDSFHGTMFSLIFGKQFYIYQALPGLFSRIENVLHQLDLEDRIVEKDGVQSFNFRQTSKEIVIPESFLISSKKYLGNAII